MSIKALIHRCRRKTFNIVTLKYFVVLLFVGFAASLYLIEAPVVRSANKDGDKSAAKARTPESSSGESRTANAPAAPDPKIPKEYVMPFGTNPFAPSNARTTTGTFIPAEKFISSTRCAQCHADTHTQWRQSAHGNAFREPFYQKNVNDMIAQKGIEFTRHCESCHNPAALFSGALTKSAQFKRPFDEDGVSCIVCHSIQAAENRGIGGYTMGEPALLLKEDGTRLLDVTDKEILADVPSHRRAMMRPLLKSPEFCAACHKSQVPHELNDYKFLRAFAVYDEYQQSSFSKQSPHPFYTRDKESCSSCHMQRVPAPLSDVSSKKGTIVGHRWPAANTAVPAFFNYKDQLEAVTRFLENDALGIDIFAVRRKVAGAENEELIAPLNRSQFNIKAGDRLTADVVITNKNIGHSFPPELRDFYEAYVEFTVKDAADKTIYSSGFIKPDGFLDESAHNYKTYLVKADGNYNDKHMIWQTRVIANNNQIPSGRSDMARYGFSIPVDAQGPLKLSARMRYRRFTRTFSNYVMGHSVDFPVVTMATTEYAMNLGENRPLPIVQGKGVPDWRRWNNYGIALLDLRQYALAADAFAHAAELDETYRPMATANRAMAFIELDRFDDAFELLDAVAKANPNNYRALFQRSRILIRRGRLAEAEADLRRIVEVYPRDRMSWQQIGELSKIKRDYTAARYAFEQIQGIDPEDTGSYYNLMLIYQKLGLKEEAKKAAKVFADQKDDPSELHIANEFLRIHPEMSNESVPWHVHN